MDPLFERRQLSKKVHIHSKFLQKNMQASILAQLKMNYEGRCSSEGYIQRNSVTVINYSLGRTNYIKGGVDYDVTFQADICMPHPGQRFKAPVKLRSKVGIHCETPPIKILIPRDLHIGNQDFENVKVDEEIEFEVVGSQFKQQDEDIIVVGKLLTSIAPPVDMPLLGAPEAKPISEEVTPIVTENPEEKRVVIAPTEAEKPKKRRLRPMTGGESNGNELTFSLKEGMA